MPTTHHALTTTCGDLRLLGQVLDLPNKVDKIIDFAWEPKGTRFALLHGEGSRPTLSLYDMEGGGKVGLFGLQGR